MNRRLLQVFLFSLVTSKEAISKEPQAQIKAGRRVDWEQLWGEGPEGVGW